MIKELTDEQGELDISLKDFIKTLHTITNEHYDENDYNFVEDEEEYES